MKYWRLLASFVLAMRAVARLFSITQEWLLIVAISNRQVFLPKADAPNQ
ncbi:hypothetical protein [Nostoc sp.]